MDGYSYGRVVTNKMICASAGVNGQGTCQVRVALFKEPSLATRDLLLSQKIPEGVNLRVRDLLQETKSGLVVAHT